MSLRLALKDEAVRKMAQKWAELPETKRILRLYREDTLRSLPVGSDLNARLLASESANGERKAIDFLLSLSAEVQPATVEESDYGRRDMLKQEFGWDDAKIDEMIAQEEKGGVE